MVLVGEVSVLILIARWLGLVIVFGPVLFLVAVCVPQVPVRLVKRFYATQMA